uniref:Enoyl-CoA hydratase 1 n=1 Tax=Pundamilia nyererei TaxID=303518 RepID=A0A3B4FB02_9CICH
MLAVVFRSAVTKYKGLRLPSQTVARAMSSSGGATPPYTTLAISRPTESITHVELHRPEKRNAMNSAFWSEMVTCFNELSEDPECRAVVVSGAGKLFTAGIDLMDMMNNVLQPEGDDTARISWALKKKIRKFQETFSVIEKCPKPVVVAIHGACVGAGVDMITACDIRLCTQDACLVNELALTARKMYADEAKSSGLVSRVFADKEAMMAGALEIAGEIAGRSPVAVQGTKINLIYARNHSVADGLDYIATWNMSMLQTEDLMKSAQAALEKKSPKTKTYSKL